jgi:hypothetical protein
MKSDRVCNIFSRRPHFSIRRLKYMWYGATTADIAGRKSDLVHELKLRHHLQIPNADTQLHSTLPLLPLSFIFID